MQPTSQIKSKLLQILSQSELPVTIEELVNALLPEFCQTRQDDANHHYSRFRTYQDGDRVFHPAAKFREWFTVEVSDENTIIARFDDGRTALLVQGELDSDAATLPHQRAKAAIEKAISETGAVVRIGNLVTLRSSLETFPWHRASNRSACLHLFRLLRKNEQMDRARDLLELGATCRKIGLRALHYIAPIENLPSIFQKGILARNLVQNLRDDFSLAEIQEHRARIIPNDSIPFTLHDYVPLFFSPRPPLIYLFKEEPERIARLLVSPTVLLEPGAIFHDMNARSPRKRSFLDPCDLGELHWEVLHANSWNTSEDKEENRLAKLYRQAEANIPLRVQTKYFVHVHVYKRNTAELVKNMACRAGLEIPVTPMGDRLFFD